jgi:cytochrome c2
MNVVFAISSLAFLAITLFMVMRDYARPWKRVQAEFRDLDRAAATRQLEQERQQIDQTQIAAVSQEIEKAKVDLEARRGETEALEEEIEEIGRRRFAADARMRATKSELDAARYEMDRALGSGDQGEITQRTERVDQLSARWMEEQREVQALDTEREAKRAALLERQSARNEADKRLAELNAALTGLETRLAALDKDLAYFALNAPLMDFLQPSLKIEQVMLPGLYHDINFATTDRVDRCMTCHQAANRAGYDGDEWAEPYRTHPRPELFVSDGSPHPYNQFGCTVCHAGLDRATDFARAGHTPENEEERAEWKREHDWKKQKYLETPIYPAGLDEAGCLTCHADSVWTPGAQVVDKGRKLVNKMGCYGCHEIDYAAFTDLPKIGPDLRRVAGKTNDGWAAKWVEAPRDFRPTTFMPHFFYQENIEGERNEAFQRAELESVVDYLWDKSERPNYPAAPAGDAARGEVLFNSVGCTGCHLMDASAEREDYLDNLERLHGPNLDGVGSKVGGGWLYAWLKNPKQYRPDTAMPNLRLTDQEAADLTSYLLRSRKPEWEQPARQPVDAAARAELVKSYLQELQTIEQSEANVAKMSEQEQSLYLGQKTIAKYGCAGCHTIAGFEDAKPIGVELTQEASKPLHLFDFGHVHEVEHSKPGWLRAKVMRPRIWDHGKELVKTYGELYKMPNFGMSEREADAVTTLLLGFTKESVREERKAWDPTTGPALAAGRKLVTRYNCQGCHLIEGKGQAIKTAITDEGKLPPNLASQGARTQADWLFSFLHDPSQVQLRPWLTVRMPTFEFTDEQVNTVIAYFQGLNRTTPFESEPPPPDRRSAAVGGEVFGMLQCARCHPAGAAALAAVGGGTADLAPSLLLAKGRLRHDWVPDWIEDPQKWVPGTKMPTNFPMSPDGKITSPLPQAIDMPAYGETKRRMLQHFSSEAELDEFLGDVDRVSTALRDYIWTL